MQALPWELENLLEARKVGTDVWNRHPCADMAGAPPVCCCIRYLQDLRRGALLLTHQILPCPNPKCRGRCWLVPARECSDAFVQCTQCRYRGPEKDTDAEAIEAHSEMLREEPWMRVEDGSPKAGESCDIALRDGRAIEFVVALRGGGFSRNTTLEWFGPEVTHWRKHVPPKHPGVK